jgi:hypothetical protein
MAVEDVVRVEDVVVVVAGDVDLLLKSRLAGSLTMEYSL